MSAIVIVVPSYARPDRLRACLAALARLDGGPYPTIVVDDGSPEPLEPVCAAAGDWVTCIRQANAGPAAARNAGVRAAADMGGDAGIVAFTDDDCLPRPGWAAALARAQGGVAGRMVGGRVENALVRNVYSAASQSLCTYLYHHHARTGGRGAFFTSNNVACRRDDFLAMGGFDESFPLAAGEDRELGLRWTRQGGTLAYVDDAVVDHAHDLTLGRFWRQHANYGRGARHLHLALAARGAPPLGLEPSGFYTGLLIWPLHRPGAARLRQAALIGLSQMAMVWGYLDARRAETDGGDGGQRQRSKPNHLMP